MRFALIFNSILLTLLAATSAIPPSLNRGTSNEEDHGRFRPTAIEMDSEGTRLVITSSNGELCVIDVSTRRILSKTKLGHDLADLSLIENGPADGFLTVDRATHQLIRFKLDSDHKPVVRWKRSVCKYPSRVSVSQDGRIAVAGHWSRQISCLKQPPGQASPENLGILDLSFVPGHLEWIDETSHQLLVIDAFGHETAVIQLPESGTTEQPIASDAILSSRQIPDRRVGGVSVSNQQIVMATQMLNPLARSTRNDVHWGLMVSNDVETFPVDRFLASDFNFSKDRKQQPIGGAGEARSDAECIVVTPSNLMVVALGGAKQIAIGSTDEFGFAYLYVGNRPVDLEIDRNEQFCYVANQLDGSMSVVDLENLQVLETVMLDGKREYTLAEQGERIFFDASVSHDGWMSCHSCHVDGHTNGLINDNLSDETFGTPKRVLSLLGHADTAPMAWNGTADSLEAQIRKSMEVTMQSDQPPSEQTINAVAAFVKSLPAPPSLHAARNQLDLDRIEQGRKLFHDLDCATCHTPPNYTSPQNYEVGLEDEKGKKEFNPPSLVGLGQRDSFFHDGRAKSLEEVFTKIEHQLTNKLPDQELSNLLAFLKSL